MISSVSDDPADGTQHVPDGPVPPVETQFVPDGPAPAGSTRVPVATRSPIETQHVADLPVFGRFRALAELGCGAMGTVYRAHDDVLGRAVAIKALHSRDSATRERFLREARAIGAVLHPNILAVYDAGIDDRTPYLVMELAAGGSLRDRIQSGPLPIDTVREIGIQIARALAAAHAANILHRDVKPANILCTSPRVTDRSRPPTESERDVWKLADFGIARLPDSTLTVEGQFLGSPSYAAPESLGAGRFSPASDVYGLGATLYEALAGSPPHGHQDIRALVRKLDEDPPPLRTRRAVPAALDAAIMATLARDPARRPTAEELAHLLSLSDLEPQPAPRAPSARTKLLALALAAIAIVLVVLAVTRHRSGAVPGVSPMLAPREQPRAEPHAPFAKPPPPPPADEHRDDRRPGPPHDIDPPREPEPPDEPSAPDPWGSPPTIVDQYGNPVDDETARRILEQMERDARDQLDGFGRKRGKHKRR